MRRARGTALVLVLVLIPVLAMVLFAVAQMLVVHQMATRQLEFGTQARLLARAGLATGIARLKTVPDFAGGISDSGFNVTVENNYRKDGTPTCPGDSVLLSSVGVSNGYSCKLTCLLAVPPYPFALASSGPIKSLSGMTLGAVPADFKGTEVKVEDLTPAELMSGAELTLKGSSDIVGNARSAGKADVDTAVVRVRDGAITGEASVDAVPVIPLKDFDFDPTLTVQTLPMDRFADKQKLSGLLQWSGSTLEFVNGLELNGATLRLHGNVVIHGGVKGAGALLVDGNVTIVGGSDLTADNKVALVASGGVNITGPGYFQGLVYAGGEDGISLKDVTVMGTVLNSGKTATGEGAPMVVEHAGVVKAGAPGVEFEQSLSGVNGFNGSNGITVAKTIPRSAFFNKQTNRWINDNVRSLSNQDGLSPVELLMLPYLEFGIAGQPRTWTSLTSSEKNKMKALLLNPSGEIKKQLPSDADASAPEIAKFKLDLSRYLKTSDRLRVVWLRPS